MNQICNFDNSSNRSNDTKLRRPIVNTFYKIGLNWFKTFQLILNDIGY